MNGRNENLVVRIDHRFVDEVKEAFEESNELRDKMTWKSKTKARVDIDVAEQLLEEGKLWGKSVRAVKEKLQQIKLRKEMGYL